MGRNRPLHRTVNLERRPDAVVIWASPFVYQHLPTMATLIKHHRRWTRRSWSGAELLSRL